MTHVRRHERQVRPGRTVNVRAHEREGGDLTAAPDWAKPAQASDFQAAPADEPDAGDWWDDGGDDDRELSRMKDGMRDWRARPEPAPSPAEPMSPQMAKLLGADTPEGLAHYERGRAYREAGYDGPLNSDNRIPDPDDPAEQASLSTLAAMSRM
jgi:hypothetical protein